MTDTHARGKLIIIGLDGATWGIMDPLFQRGKLPNLYRLVQEGASGDLRSLEPMISTMLWTCISSGKLPDEHGVRDFAVSSRAVKCKRLWDIFAQQGFSVGVYGHLITWPPDPIEGFIVPGTFALGPETHPPELAFLRKLSMEEASGSNRGSLTYLNYGLKALRNGVRLPTMWRLGTHLAREMIASSDPLMNFYRKRLMKLYLDRDVFGHLCRKYRPGFAYFYTHLLDSSQHIFWKYMEPESFADVDKSDILRYGHVVEEAYQQADATVGRILSAMGPETTVMIVSDHGAQAVAQSAEGSAWSIKTENLLRMMGLWEKVRAVNIGFALYLSSRPDGPAAREQVIDLFQKIVAEETGGQVFTVTPMEHSFLKVQIQEAEVQRFQGSMIRVGESSCPFEDIVEVSSGRVSGTHHPDGICILWGEPIRRHFKIQRAGLLDVAPTALMLMGLPVARDMAGRPMEEAVTDRFLGSHPVRYQQTYEDEKKPATEESQEVPMPEDLVNQLKALGYM
ncbi:alkaline phosphatase family protein [Candidatus Zixiibacteriota bacterium]